MPLTDLSLVELRTSILRDGTTCNRLGPSITNFEKCTIGLPVAGSYGGIFSNEITSCQMIVASVKLPKLPSTKSKEFSYLNFY